MSYDDPGKRRVYLYSLAETRDQLAQNLATSPRVKVPYRLQEFPVTDDPSYVAD